MIDLDEPLVKPATITAIDEAMAREEAARIPRGHLGMSQIGKTDERSLWLKFRWSLPDTPAPRTLRIFQLGNYIEMEIARLLRMIPGVELLTADPDSGEQFNFSYLGGHFGGSMDGCVIGLVEASKTWHVWEAKSVSHKRFADLCAKGVKVWSPEYYAQLQCYMGATGMDRALFTAYDKDDSTLYQERVKKEPMFWEAMQEKALRIIETPYPPASSFKDRTWYEAKWMSEEAQAIYWGDALPKPNCRNCSQCQPITEGEGARWWCHRDDESKDLIQQHRGCENHTFLPCFLESFAEPVEWGDSGQGIYRQKDNGRMFVNCGPTEMPSTDLRNDDEPISIYTSAELYALDVSLIGDAGLDDIKNTFKAHATSSERKAA